MNARGPNVSMGTLLVGFDSAWTRTNAGAIVGALIDDTGGIHELGLPRLVRYAEARDVVAAWQLAHLPSLTLVLIDQPTIVENGARQRPVEQIVCSAVSRRRGGMQPANRARLEMFGDDAPVWEFVRQFGGAADPFDVSQSTKVLETYPVLAMMSMGWVLPDPRRPAGRLPKYNPERRKTFALADWVHVCRAGAATLRAAGATDLAVWIEEAGQNPKPTKSDQDRLDSCICLIAALHLAKGSNALFVGNCATGYIVVPDSLALREELALRCLELALVPSDWIRVLQFGDAASPLAGAAI